MEKLNERKPKKRSFHELTSLGTNWVLNEKVKIETITKARLTMRGDQEEATDHIIIIIQNYIQLFKLKDSKVSIFSQLKPNLLRFTQPKTQLSRSPSVDGGPSGVWKTNN